MDTASRATCGLVVPSGTELGDSGDAAAADESSALTVVSFRLGCRRTGRAKGLVYCQINIRSNSPASPTPSVSRYGDNSRGEFDLVYQD